MEKLTVSFDDATWRQLDTISVETALPKAGVLRRAIRILAWLLKKQDEGYKVALLKEGEPPLLVELV
ncbi:hypothetical protein HYT45_01065 [Candidatus Uhrbacteria bacterium]|nr:hypothetical protein [Candidatus Uhrbacteria bacterium]